MSIQKRVTINKDLLLEREKCTFDPMELTYIWDGSKNKTLERCRRESFILSDPMLQDTIPMKYKSHKEQYEEAIRKSCRLIEKLRELQDRGECDMDSLTHILGGSLGSAVLQDGNPLLLHFVMFIPAILGQGTPEQQAEWLAKAWACNIIGTYAQTELGHGTFIRGLETTATYDPSREEFVLHSPSLTSYKWWPGGLGKTANYAVVLAQLYTQNDCKGIHPFIVQLRDEETHEPLPGIKIGEIGTKLGMNSTDNGFLGFNNVRIPRKQMLMKHSQVLQDGTYVKGKNQKLTYGTMIFVRVVIVREHSNLLSKAATIAIRYSAVRRQGQINPDGPETQIIDFVTQQYKLFPNLAACFVFRLASDWIWDIYNAIVAELNEGELERLPELHALSCCLKAVATSDSSSGIEQLRQACGGHGYMNASNLPITYGIATAACTYEGENTVLLLQTARYLVKAYKQALDGQSLPKTVSYLTAYVRGEKQRPWTCTLDCMVKAYHTVAASKIALATENMDSRLRKGVCPEDAWNQTSIELMYSAEAHCRAVLVMLYVESVKNVTPASRELPKIMLQLCELYTIHWILRQLGNFLQFSNLRNKDVPVLQKRLEELLTAIRPNAVGIVDGFDLRDEILNSALGAYDGNVYQRLFDEAMKSPLNQENVNQSFNKYMKPFFFNSKL